MYVIRQNILQLSEDDVQECSKKFEVDPKYLPIVQDKLNDGVKLEPEYQTKIGCMFLCRLQNRGIWRAGSIDVAEMEAKLADFKRLKDLSNPKANIKKCAAQRRGADCDSVFEFMQCLNAIANVTEMKWAPSN